MRAEEFKIRYMYIRLIENGRRFWWVEVVRSFNKFLENASRFGNGYRSVGNRKPQTEIHLDKDEWGTDLTPRNQRQTQDMTRGGVRY